MQPRHMKNRVGASVLALAGAVTPVTAQGAPTTSTSPAHPANPARPVIVVEAYVGARPSGADAIMTPLLDELEQRGFVARSELVRQRLGGDAPRPGALDRYRSAAEITQPAEAGYVAYSRGRFAEAEAILKQAIEQIHRNPALLVLDTNNLDATFKILVALALSQAKRGDTGGSVATMIELIRTFRSQPITRADYGPDAEQLYRAVWKQVQAMGRGRLAITVENDQAVLFVNGQIRGMGRATLVDLVPGVYRVFVQVPGTAGRQYEVAVNAGELAQLHVDWEVDSALWMTDAWIGFVFATEAERASQAAFAGVLARRWRHLIAVVGTVQLRDRSGVIATLYDATGTVVRSAVIPVAAADERTLRSLARFLADGTAGDDIHVLRDIDHRDSRDATATAGPVLVPSLLVGAGAAAMITGGVLVAIDQDPGPQSPARYRDSAPTGIVVGAAGVAAVGLGLWLWRTRSGRSAPILSVGARGGFIGWGGEL